MSEYQYHEWQTIDRLLSAQEQERVDQLSSHIEVSASRAVVTYHWSDFRHDPKKVLLDFFDAYLYVANWGTIRLMYRFPQHLIDKVAIAPYCDDEYVVFEDHGDYQILDIHFDPDYGEGWMQAEGLSNLVGLRDDLIAGDYRLLYLAWLTKVTLLENYAYDDQDVDSNLDVFEPPVPPGLQDISPSLSHFVDMMELDYFLVLAAAEESATLKSEPISNYAELIAKLTRAECNTFLADLVEGKPGVAQSLRKRLQEFSPKRTSEYQKTSRSLAQLQQRAVILQKAEQKRRAEVARRKHIQEMEALSQREAQVWQEIKNQLAHGRRIASVYDAVTEQLSKLKQLSEYQKQPLVFQTRIQELAKQYANRHALIRRWKSKNWV